MEDWLRTGAEIFGPVQGVQQALAIIEDQETQLDAALLDINLGRGETVYPVADRLNELGIPYLFATGDVRVIDDPAHRARPRLNKPVSRGDLLRALRKLLVL